MVQPDIAFDRALSSTECRLEEHGRTQFNGRCIEREYILEAEAVFFGQCLANGPAAFHTGPQTTRVAVVR